MSFANNIMTKNIVTVKANDGVLDALKTMKKNNIGAVIVKDKNGRIRYKIVDKRPALTKTSTIIKELPAIQ